MKYGLWLSDSKFYVGKGAALVLLDSLKGCQGDIAQTCTREHENIRLKEMIEKRGFSRIVSLLEGPPNPVAVTGKEADMSYFALGPHTTCDSYDRDRSRQL